MSNSASTQPYSTPLLTPFFILSSPKASNEQTPSEDTLSHDMHTSNKHRSESFKHTCGDRQGFDPNILGKDILFHITIKRERHYFRYLDCTAPWYYRGDLGLEINKGYVITASGGGKGPSFAYVNTAIVVCSLILREAMNVPFPAVIDNQII